MESERFILSDTPHSAIRRKGFPLDSLSIDIRTKKYYYDLPLERRSKFADQDGFFAFFQNISNCAVAIRGSNRIVRNILAFEERN